MKLNILKSFSFFEKFKFIEIEFNADNLKNLRQARIVKMHDREFIYTCYRIGNYISIQKSGKLFGNSGSHGVYEYDLTTGSFEKTLHKYQDNHVLSLLRFKHG